MSAVLTETVHLTEGMRAGERCYKVVVVRAPRYQDTLDVEKAHKGEGVLCTTAAILLKSIVDVGNQDKNGEWTEKLDKDKFGMDLMGSLNEADLERIQDAREYLKKKAELAEDGLKEKRTLILALMKHGFTYADLQEMDEAELHSYCAILFSSKSSSGRKANTYLPGPT